MEEALDGQEDGLANDVGESLGMSEQDNAADKGEGSHSAETLNVQKRLKAQKRAHEREVRDLHARIGDLESRMVQPNMPQNQPVNSYPVGNGAPGDEQIHKAVSYALQHRDMEERKARDAQSQAHVQRQYGELQKHLDGMNDKYDDFHDVVYGAGTPYTTHMRDYAMTLPKSGAGSAGEVLYKLGHPDNREEFDRIRNLHPLDQASEMAKLSHSLMRGGEKSSNAVSKSPLGNIKNTPITNSREVTDKTPVSELRARMKSNWK